MCSPFRSEVTRNLSNFKHRKKCILEMILVIDKGTCNNVRFITLPILSFRIASNAGLYTTLRNFMQTRYLLKNRTEYQTNIRFCNDFRQCSQSHSIGNYIKLLGSHLYCRQARTANSCGISTFNYTCVRIFNGIGTSIHML